MENPSKNSVTGRNRTADADQRTNLLTPEHALRLLFHRKWLILGVFALVTAVTVVITARLPNIYSSDTLILVDPQRVPESYVKATVSGDIFNRLGTLKQQILSATRLQKIIDNLNLYAVERKTMAREDVIMQMRSAIGVSVVSDFGGGQNLQAFRISYSGDDPQLVAQVANELASLFIEENLKAREQQAEGTTEFLTNQLEETRKTLEEQEAKLRDFRMKHLGEMPEQETADIQILAHLQSQLQLEADSLNRAEQQRAYIQSMMASQTAAGVVDLDDGQAVRPVAVEAKISQAPAAPPVNPAAAAAAAKEKQLAALLAHGYTETYPDVRKLKQEIGQLAKKSSEPGPGGTSAGALGSTPARAAGSTPAGAAGTTPAGVAGNTPAGAAGSTSAGAAGSTPAGAVGSTPAGATGSAPGVAPQAVAPQAVAPQAVAPQAPPQVAQIPPPPAPAARQPLAAPHYVNPVLRSQLNAAEYEIAKHKEQVQALSKQIGGYQAKLEAIPVREQQIAELQRDYEISKAHYGQLLNSQLSATTGTQLEVRQKGEKFSILDPAQPAQKPSRPNRELLNLGGSVGGLALGLFLALVTELLGMSITSAEHLTAASGFPVLEVIPLIETRMDRLARRRRMFMAAASGAAAALTVGAVLAYHFRARFF